jgi:hypothetical protein
MVYLWQTLGLGTSHMQQQQQQQQPLQEALSELRSLSIIASEHTLEDAAKLLGVLAASCQQLRQLTIKMEVGYERTVSPAFTRVLDILAAPRTFPALQDLCVKRYGYNPSEDQVGWSS